MVDRLRVVIATIERLPEDKQEQIAEHLETWIHDQQWDDWLKSEEGSQFLDELRAGYEQEEQQGTIRDGGW